MRWVSLPFLFVALVSIPRIAWPQGMPLGPEFRVNTYTQYYQRAPSLASDAAGNFVVVWDSFVQDGSYRGVFGQRYDSSGGPLGPEFRVNTFTTSDQFLPSVAVDPSGNFVVVWESETQDGSSSAVVGQRYDSSGAPLGPEFRVNTYTPGGQNRPSVAADADGNFVVAWDSSSQDGEFGGVFGQRFASSGAPLGPEFRVNTLTTSDQARPSVAVDTAGNFVVVWRSLLQDGEDGGIYAQRYDSSGAPLSLEFLVNTFTTSSQDYPSVAADATGNFVIVWQSNAQDSPPFGWGVFGQRYASAGAALGPEFRVNTFTTGDQSIPSVAADSAGNFVVAWSSDGQDGFQTGVFGQRYASAGAALGPEFRVNTYTTAAQSYPSVAADSAGNFVVAWSSDGQDGFQTGVFGQRYGQIVPLELMRFTVE